MNKRRLKQRLALAGRNELRCSFGSGCKILLRLDHHTAWDKRTGSITDFMPS
jgi:hypothetical protein